MPGEPVTEREHADLIMRVGRGELRVDRLEERVDKVEGRMDRLEGMVTLLRIIFGTTVIGAVAGVLALLELLRHAGL